MKKQKILDRYAFREKYGGIPKDRLGPNIDPQDVPAELRLLIPLAEKWGIVEDDWEPQNVIREVSKEEIEDLVSRVSPYSTDHADDPFNEWLGGPEASTSRFSEAYRAFTELRIVFEYGKWLLEHWGEVKQTADTDMDD